jgi:hypothetical protein
VFDGHINMGNRYAGGGIAWNTNLLRTNIRKISVSKRLTTHVLGSTMPIHCLSPAPDNVHRRNQNKRVCVTRSSSTPECNINSHCKLGATRCDCLHLGTQWVVSTRRFAGTSSFSCWCRGKGRSTIHAQCEN